MGDPTGGADLSEVYVVKVDGRSSAGRTRPASCSTTPSGAGTSIREILHRAAPVREDRLRDIKDIAQIIGNIGVTPGVLVAAELKFSRQFSAHDLI